ncbi:hypothetical protein ACIQV3_22440 [Streptomyces sp. NPDC099050]|uniref:hypothetical protein n=1 Tax=Streptomyces sp. NPDC099050 TaxID=3366100 RepID=UPI0038120A66
MSPWETVGACIATAVGLYLIATYGWDAWHKRRPDRRFQATAKQAARAPRDEDAVRRDRAKAKAARDLVEQQAFDLTFTQIIAAEFPTIPHQTRRTEEDQ